MPKDYWLSGGRRFSEIFFPNTNTEIFLAVRQHVVEIGSFSRVVFAKRKRVSFGHCRDDTYQHERFLIGK